MQAMFSVDLVMASREHLNNTLPAILVAFEGILQVSTANLVVSAGTMPLAWIVEHASSFTSRTVLVNWCNTPVRCRRVWLTCMMLAGRTWMSSQTTYAWS